VISQDEIGDLNSERKETVSPVTDTVFLKLISTGKKLTLFAYKDNLKTRFYISDGGAQPIELSYSTYFSTSTGTPVLQYNNRFRIELQLLAQKHNMLTSGLQRQLSTIDYRQGDITHVVQQINNNKNSAAAATNAGVRFFVGASAVASTFTLHGNSHFTKAPSGKNALAPQVSAGMDIFLNKVTQVVYFRLGLSFSIADYKFIETSPTTNSQTVIRTSKMDVSQKNISLTPLIVYNVYNQPDLKVFIAAGATVHYSLYNDYEVVDTYSNFTTTSSFKREPELAKGWIPTPTVKAGVVLNKKFEIFAGYLPKTQLADNPNYDAKIVAYEGGFNYFF
jgi:hypothetical protein